jgi:hypothetical protein
MYSRALSRAVSAVTMRAKIGTWAMAMARMRFCALAPERGDDHDRQQDQREGQQRVHQPHEHGLREAAEVARDQPDERPDRRREQHGQQRDEHERARP